MVGYPITFSKEDQHGPPDAAGQLPLIIAPTIRNVLVAHTLLDGGAGLNLLSLRIFNLMQVPPVDLVPSLPFFGVTPGSVDPRGQMVLPVTLGDRENLCTENITFDVAEFDLPFNAILGRPAMAHFMIATHYAYLVAKLPGPH